MADETKGRRGANFTAGERDLLVELIARHPCIVSKQSDTDTKGNKAKAWKLIADAFNSKFLSAPRTAEQLKKKFDSLKKVNNEKKCGMRLDHYGTGGGPSTSKPFTHFEERFEGLEGSYDPDRAQGDFPSLLDEGVEIESGARDGSPEPRRGTQVGLRGDSQEADEESDRWENGYSPADLRTPIHPLLRRDAVMVINVPGTEETEEDEVDARASVSMPPPRGPVSQTGPAKAGTGFTDWFTPKTNSRRVRKNKNTVARDAVEELSMSKKELTEIRVSYAKKELEELQREHERREILFQAEMKIKDAQLKLLERDLNKN